MRSDFAEIIVRIERQKSKARSLEERTQTLLQRIAEAEAQREEARKERELLARIIRWTKKI